MKIYGYLNRENFKWSIKTYFEVCNYRATPKESKSNSLKEDKWIILLYINIWSQNNKVNNYDTELLTNLRAATVTPGGFSQQIARHDG